MLEQHGVCGAEFGDFVEAASDEVAGDDGEGGLREVGGLAVYDSLKLRLKLVKIHKM